MNLLSIRGATKKLAISRTSLWRIAKDDPTFPRPINISGGRKAFLESELDEYIAKCVAARDEVAA